MKRLLLTLFALVTVATVQARPTQKSITSPDGSLTVTVTVDKDVRWSVKDSSQTILAPSQIAMQIGEEEVWGVNPTLGPLNIGLQDLGLGFLKTAWLGNEKTAMIAISVANAWQYTG
ncbi:MAG: glycoside hydrolase family 97 N-terminal domain-containing protein, partial [Alistipes sp.]|nr:glycoside hydrolase family 97 N-terminal domain-containing protein [Alistipes sp.]